MSIAASAPAWWVGLVAIALAIGLGMAVPIFMSPPADPVSRFAIRLTVLALIVATTSLLLSSLTPIPLREFGLLTLVLGFCTAGILHTVVYVRHLRRGR